MARIKTAKIRAEKPINDASGIKTNNYPKKGADALEGNLEPIYLTVNTIKPALNIREVPNGLIIGSVPKGAKVELIRKTTANWYEIRYQGKTGYCFSKHLKA